MKFTTKSYANLMRVALCTIVMNSFAHGAETDNAMIQTSTAIVKSTGSFIVKVEQILSQFFNKDNDISYNDCDILLGKTLSEFINKIEQLAENTNNKFVKMSYDIAVEARKHFNAAYSVIKQYNGRPATDAPKFKNDIERIFSPEVAFSSITTKLQTLYKEAEATQQTELMHVIQQLMLVLEKKKAEWNKKSGPSLLTGLAIRMCK